MKWLKIGFTVMPCWLALANAQAAETGAALRDTDIRKEAFGDAQLVATLKASDKVQILAKDGGWLKIKSTRGQGWVRMLSIRKDEGKAAKNETKGLLNVASGRAGTGKVVASTGVRGLGEEELKAAKFNAQELQLAESYSVSNAQAQQFANAGKLVARKFDYLPEVK